MQVRGIKALKFEVPNHRSQLRSFGLALGSGFGKMLLVAKLMSWSILVLWLIFTKGPRNLPHDFEPFPIRIEPALVHHLGYYPFTFAISVRMLASRIFCGHLAF